MGIKLALHWIRIKLSFFAYFKQIFILDQECQRTLALALALALVLAEAGCSVQ